MKRLIVVLIILLSLGFETKPQERLFDSSSIIKIDIVANLKELFRDVNPEKAIHHSGFLSYIDSEGNSVNVRIKLKTRGIFRRSRENCNTPPLSIKFIDENLDKTIFAQIEKLKLVNTCNRNRETYQQFIFKEYLAYRLYNLFSEYSFKVRMVKIVYVDISNSFAPFESYGFFIEDMESLMRRTETKTLKTLGIVQEGVDRDNMDITAVFQFMIGNTDWSVPRQHNIKLLIKDSVLTPIALPYDFDFCGFVNPPYTKPPEIIPIKNVTERYYRGFCRSQRELEPTINIFNEKKDLVYGLINADTLLNKKHKEWTIRYIDEFYTILSNPKRVKTEFIDNCRTN